METPVGVVVTNRSGLDSVANDRSRRPVSYGIGRRRIAIAWLRFTSLATSTSNRGADLDKRNNARRTRLVPDCAKLQVNRQLRVGVYHQPTTAAPFGHNGWSPAPAVQLVRAAPHSLQTLIRASVQLPIQTLRRWSWSKCPRSIAPSSERQRTTGNGPVWLWSRTRLHRSSVPQCPERTRSASTRPRPPWQAPETRLSDRYRLALPLVQLRINRSIDRSV
jgi:hypothetical protein